MVELKSVGRQQFVYHQNFGKVLLTAALRSGCSMHAFVFDAFDEIGLLLRLCFSVPVFSSS